MMSRICTDTTATPQEGYALRRALAALCLPAGVAVAVYTCVQLMDRAAVLARGTPIPVIIFTGTVFNSGATYAITVFGLLSTPKLARRVAGWSESTVVTLLIEALALVSYVA